VVILGASAAIRQVPDFNDLFASELMLADQEFAEAAVDPPAPALAATGALFIRILGSISRRRQCKNRRFRRLLG